MPKKIILQGPVVQVQYVMKILNIKHNLSFEQVQEAGGNFSEHFKY